MKTQSHAQPPAAGEAAHKEPLHFVLRAIVALSENIIDDQDPCAVFDPHAVGETGRAIRQTANGALTKAIRLHESHVVLVAALESAEKRADAVAASMHFSDPSALRSELRLIAARLRAALAAAKA